MGPRLSLLLVMPSYLTHRLMASQTIGRLIAPKPIPPAKQFPMQTFYLILHFFKAPHNWLLTQVSVEM